MRAICLGVVLCACSQAPEGDQARVAPLDLVMDNRVVLTPGNSVTIPVKILRSDPEPEHPVQLELSGGGGSGVFVSWEPAVGATVNTKDARATLTISVAATATAQEVAYAVDGKLGLHDDHEALVVSVQIASMDAFTTEQYAPGVTGVMKTATLNGQEITYEVINGIAILGGDIELGDEQTMLARSQLRSATCNPNFHTDFACSAWTNGVIGYSYANNWGDEPTNERMRLIIGDAMREWTRMTGIRFVPRTSGERIQFQDGDGCSAGIGRVVLTGIDPQYVRLNNTGCADIGRAMHEIGHAIGLYHEQMRNDRGNWVSINWGRIQEDHSGNFFQIGDYLINRGVYDYDSIMHYEPWAFAKNEDACFDGDLNECTILPTNPANANIGQRDHLSEGDAHGVYKLYPPVFSIGGATDGETGDRFHLVLDYERGRPGVGADYDYVEWRSNRVDEPLGRGNSVDIRADQVPVGINEISARFVVRGETFRTESITLNFQNERPVLEVFAVNGRHEQEMNQLFSVVVTVNDAEDGVCSGCLVSWDPVPSAGPTDLRTAAFSFGVAGTRTIRVTVEDLAGGRTTAALTVEIVNSAPVVTILTPSEGSTFTDNTAIRFRGRGIDANTGSLGCTGLTWTSNQPADVITPHTFPGWDGSCEARIRLTGIGPRTVTLTGTDGVNTTSDTVSFMVLSAACTAEGCPPIAYFEMPDPDRPDGTYLIEREMEIVVWVGDIDVHSPIRYTLHARRVGTTSPIIRITPFEQIEVFSDAEHLAIGVDEWTPSSYVGGGWDNCVTETRDYEVTLTATDSSGMTTTFSRIFTLACDLI